MIIWRQRGWRGLKGRKCSGGIVEVEYWESEGSGGTIVGEWRECESGVEVEVECERRSEIVAVRKWE